MPKTQYSVVDGLSREEVLMMTPKKLKEIYDILLDEGNVEEEFDPFMIGEDPTDVGVREQQELFRNYLLDLISSSDVESSGEKEDTEDFYDPFAPNFVPEEKCRPEPDNFINCSMPNMYCDIGSGLCRPKQFFEVTLNVDRKRVGGTKQQVDRWSIQLEQHKQSLIKLKDKKELVVVPPGEIPAKLVFTKDFQEKVKSVSRIEDLRILADQAEIKYDQNISLETLRLLVLAKVNAGIISDVQALQIKCDLDVKEMKDFKGCPPPKVCDVDNGDCLDVIPRREASISANVNGFNVFGSVKAVNAFTDKLRMGREVKLVPQSIPKYVPQPIIEPIYPIVEPVILDNDERKEPPLATEKEYMGYKVSQINPSLTVVKLKEIATLMKLKTSGNKDPLMERIRDAIRLNGIIPQLKVPITVHPSPKPLMPAVPEKLPQKLVIPELPNIAPIVPPQSPPKMSDPIYRGVRLSSVTGALTVVKLKDIAGALGVVKTGVKDVLLKRIQDEIRLKGIITPVKRPPSPKPLVFEPAVRLPSPKPFVTPVKRLSPKPLVSTPVKRPSPKPLVFEPAVRLPSPKNPIVFEPAVRLPSPKNPIVFEPAIRPPSPKTPIVFEPAVRPPQKPLGELIYRGIILSSITEKLKVVELKEIAGILGVAKSGNKEPLMKRIREAIQIHGTRSEVLPQQMPQPLPQYVVPQPQHVPQPQQMPQPLPQYAVPQPQPQHVPQPQYVPQPQHVPQPQYVPQPQQMPRLEQVPQPYLSVIPEEGGDRPVKPTIGSVKKLTSEADKIKLDQIQARLQKCAGLIA